MLSRRRLLKLLPGVYGIYVPPQLRELPLPGSYAAVSPSLGPQRPPVQPQVPTAPRRLQGPPRTGDGGLVRDE